MSTTIHQFEVIGRHKAEGQDREPKIYRMKLFAPNEVVAKSRFWYYMSKQCKVKRANGEILECHRIAEKNTNTVKNYALCVRYDSRSGTHNMYKEVRDVSLTGAVAKIYEEMASRHRARKSSVQITRTTVIAPKDVKRENVRQFLDSKIKFRLMHRLPRASAPRFAKIFKASRPSTFF